MASLVNICMFLFLCTVESLVYADGKMDTELELLQMLRKLTDDKPSGKEDIGKEQRMKTAASTDLGSQLEDQTTGNRVQQRENAARADLSSQLAANNNVKRGRQSGRNLFLSMLERSNHYMHPSTMCMDEWDTCGPYVRCCNKGPLYQSEELCCFYFPDHMGEKQRNGMCLKKKLSERLQEMKLG